MRIETHAGKNAAHVGKALRNTWHRIVSVDLVFEVDPPPVANGDERKKDVVDRHDALADSDLAVYARKVGKVLHVDVEDAGTDGAYRLRHISARPRSVSNVNATADARVQIANVFENVERAGPEFVFRTMVMDCDLDIVFLNELFNARQCGGRWIAGHDDFDPSTLAVFKLCADIVVFIFWEINCTGG